MMNEEQIFLANAYLDGELTDDERRIAEADPAVMAEVGALRALQASIRDVEPPADAARESAIAAAMAVFGSTAAAATAEPAPAPVVPFRPRPAYSRYLAIAAAVVSLGVLGVVVANVSTGGDDDDAGDDSAATEARAEEASEAPAAVGDAGGDPEFAEESAPELEGSTQLAEGDDMAEGGDMAAEPADEPAEESADAASDGASESEADAALDSDDRAAAPGFDLVASLVGGSEEFPITTPDELGEYGANLLDLGRAGLLPPSPETACPAPIVGRGFVSFDGLVDEYLIAVDDIDQLVTAIDDDNCDVVLGGPLDR